MGKRGSRNYFCSFEYHISNLSSSELNDVYKWWVQYMGVGTMLKLIKSCRFKNQIRQNECDRLEDQTVVCYLKYIYFPYRLFFFSFACKDISSVFVEVKMLC